MLARRREQIIVLLGLLGLNLGLAWSLERYWKDYRSRTQWVYAQPAPVTSTSPSELSRAPAAAQSFAEIVNRTIFRPERTNEVATESAKAPELPLLYGTMNLGDGLFAMMAPGDQLTGLSKRVFPGDEIGGYKLVSIARSQVVVEWGEKKVTIDVSESARRVPRVIEKTAKTAATSPPGASSSAGTGSQATTVGSAASRSVVVGSGKSSGAFAGFNAPPAAPPDAPVGAVVGGKRKVMRMSMMGPTYWWEDAEQPKAPPEAMNPKKEK
jgi:hypothetical protein